MLPVLAVLPNAFGAPATTCWFPVSASCRLGHYLWLAHTLSLSLLRLLMHTLRIRSVCSCQSIIWLLIFGLKTLACFALPAFRAIFFLYFYCIFAAFTLHLSGWKLPVKRKVVVKIVKSLFLSAFRCVQHTHTHIIYILLSIEFESLSDCFLKRRLRQNQSKAKQTKLNSTQLFPPQRIAALPFQHFVGFAFSSFLFLGLSW